MQPEHVSATAIPICWLKLKLQGGANIGAGECASTVMPTGFSRSFGDAFASLLFDGSVGGRPAVVGVDRPIGVQHEPAGGLRLLDRAAREPGMGGVFPLAHPLHSWPENSNIMIHLGA